MIERPEEFNELLDEFLAGLKSGEGAERVSAVSR
jgi:hypothetical protein